MYDGGDGGDSDDGDDGDGGDSDGDRLTYCFVVFFNNSLKKFIMSESTQNRTYISICNREGERRRGVFDYKGSNGKKEVNLKERWRKDEMYFITWL